MVAGTTLAGNVPSGGLQPSKKGPAGSRADRKFRLPRLAVLARLGILAAILVPSAARGQDTADFFRQNCVNCHTIGGGRLTGPDLKDVLKRQSREWLVNFVSDPTTMLVSGDPYAQKLLKASNNVPMPRIAGMTRDRAKKLLQLIEDESKLEKSQFHGIQISNKPFTAKDRALGLAIFLGQEPLKKGGTSCLSCHSVYGLPSLGGGRLGPDLTNVYERLKGRKSFSAWLMAPGTETMRPIFKNHPLTADEIHALVAFFEGSAVHQPSSPSVNRMTLLLLGMVFSSVLVFVFDSLWRDRFRGVRRSLVEQCNAQKSNSQRGN